MKRILNLIRKEPEPVDTTLKNIFNKHPVRVATYTHSCGYQPSTSRTNIKLCPGLPISIIQNKTGNIKKITNRNAKSLEPGVYLFLIMYNRITEKFSIRFSPVSSRQEIMSRHFLLANTSHPHTNFVVAAGELKKLRSGTVIFNLLSGTFMQPLMNTYRSLLNNKVNVTNKVKSLVQKVLNTPSFYVKKELIPQVNTPLKNIVRPGVRVSISRKAIRKGVPQINLLENYVKWFKSTTRTRSKGIVNKKFSLSK